MDHSARADLADGGASNELKGLVDSELELLYSSLMESGDLVGAARFQNIFSTTPSSMSPPS